MKKIFPFFTFLLFLLPLTASAHTGIGMTSGFWHGALHPLSGLDHMIAMIAVGVWATQLGKRAVWAVPATFVSVMILGGVLGAAGVTIPFVEEGIILSVLILGILIAAAKKLPLLASMLIVGAFAVVHGHAHGAEIPALASGVSYAAGFAIVTALLHITGIVLGRTLATRTGTAVVRYAGVGIGLSALILFLS